MGSTYSTLLDSTSFATGAKAALTIKSTNARVEILGFTVAFKGVTASDAPAIVQVLRFTSDGTTPAATPTPVEFQTPGRASDCTVGAGVYSAEPTAGNIFFQTFLTPNGGTLWVPFSRDERPQLEPAVRGGILINTAATVNATASLWWTED